MLAAENYGDSEYVISFVRLPFAKTDNKDVENAAVKIIFLLSAFANGSVSHN